MPGERKTFRYTRADLKAKASAGYRWWRHTLLIAAFALTGIAIAVSQLHAPGPAEWLFFAGMLLLTNFGEYWIHRRSLHRPAFPYAVYHRHVVEHHAFFGYDTMAVDELGDIRWVLFPPWALPLMMITVLPIFFLWRAIAPPNFAWVFLLAVVVYYGIYEIFHALAHFPADHPLAGNRIVRAVTHHHRVHHDPALMKRYNFNFAIPIFDWLHGTIYDESTRAEPAATPR